MPRKPNLFKRVFLPVFFLFLLTVFLARMAFDREFFGMLDARFWGQLWRVGQVMEIAHQNYLHGDDAAYNKLTDSALGHVLDGLDRFSYYMPEKDYASFLNQSKQHLVGIGVELERRNGHIQVVRVFNGSPAFAAGWRPLDRIVKVGNTSVGDLNVQGVADLLKGPEDTTVRVTRERPGGGEGEETLTRGGFDVPNIRDVELREDNVGYLHIIGFGDKTGDEFAEAVRDLMTRGMRGLIVDLRDNPGGLVDAAIDVLDPLLPQGTLVKTTHGRNGELLSKTYTLGTSKVHYNGPLVVLVNENSASASEIVAGALQDTHRAVIVGTRTYGKGIEQSVIPLGDGTGLRLTTEAYFLPTGRSIQDVGIAPDVYQTQSDEEHDLQRIQRADLHNLTAEQFTHTFGFSPDPDNQVETAAGLIVAATPDYVK